MVNLLLDSGADPAVNNNEGRSPSDLALFWGHASVAETIAKKAGKKLPAKPTISLGGGGGKAAAGGKAGGVGKGGAAKSPLISLKGGAPKAATSAKASAVAAAPKAGPVMRVGPAHVNFFAGVPLKRWVFRLVGGREHDL